VIYYYFIVQYSNQLSKKWPAFCTGYLATFIKNDFMDSAFDGLEIMEGIILDKTRLLE